MSVHLVCILMCVHCGNLSYACVCPKAWVFQLRIYIETPTPPALLPPTHSTTTTTLLHHHHHHHTPPPAQPHSTTTPHFTPTTTLHHCLPLQLPPPPSITTIPLYYIYTTTTTILLHHQTLSHSTTPTNTTMLPIYILCRHNYVACNCPITFACLVYSPLQTCVVGLVSCFPKPPLSPATNAFLPALSSQRAVACL